MRAVRQEWDERAAELAANVVAYATGIGIDEVLSTTRGTNEAATARQAAMYLTHVAFEMSLGRVAAAFKRDRSTVSHACHLMEERRDNRDVDAWLEAMERVLKRAPPAVPPPAALSMPR